MNSFRSIFIYQGRTGKQPFTEWLKSLKDQTARRQVRSRLDRLVAGHFGDCKSVGDGVYELRIHSGPGYRLYYAEVENSFILLLYAGSKQSQSKDIKIAKQYWKDYQEDQDNG